MTEDEPPTLPPLKWTYREDPEPSWRAEKYVISIVSGAAGVSFSAPTSSDLASLRRGTPAPWSMPRRRPSGTG
jgi:hypothetical protein